MTQEVKDRLKCMCLAKYAWFYERLRLAEMEFKTPHNSKRLQEAAELMYRARENYPKGTDTLVYKM
jgi:hypothetical protein